MGQNLSDIADKIRGSGPIDFPEQIKIPGIKLIKVGLTVYDLKNQIRVLQAKADTFSQGISSENLHNQAESTIKNL